MSHALVHLVTARASLFTDYRMSSLPILAKYKPFKICEHAWTPTVVKPSGCPNMELKPKQKLNLLVVRTYCMTTRLFLREVHDQSNIVFHCASCLDSLRLPRVVRSQCGLCRLASGAFGSDMSLVFSVAVVCDCSQSVRQLLACVGQFVLFIAGSCLASFWLCTLVVLFRADVF